MITDQQEEDLLGKYFDHMVALYLQLRASQAGDASHSTTTRPGLLMQRRNLTSRVNMQS